MDIQILIGMPLGYAKSVLEENNIPYIIKETVARSRFFVCDKGQSYVIRVHRENDTVVLLTDFNMRMSDSVKAALDTLEGRI